MRCRALTFLCLACASAAYASSEPTKTDEHVQAAPDATQSQTPGAYQFVDPKAVSAMRSFFGQPGMGLTSDKAILSLAAGNPVAGRPAPQLGAPFVAPFKPPTGAEAKAWETYNLRMLSFWYKFEYGFFMFKAMTKEEGKWLDASIAYFELLAHGHLSANMFLQLYSAMDELKTLGTPKDAAGYSKAYALWFKLRTAHTMLFYLYFENTFDMLTILSAAGMAVDRKIYAAFGQYAVWTKLFAYFTWDGLLSTEQYGLTYDGKAFDNAKQTKLATVAMFKKFTGAQIMMAMSEVAPATPQMKKYFAFIMPWMGIGMPYSIDAALALANPSATTPGTVPGAGASLVSDHPAAGSTPPASEKAADSKEAKAGEAKEKEKKA